MAKIWKLRGRVVEVGAIESDSIAEMIDGRQRKIHTRTYNFITIEDEKGVKHDLPSCSVFGEAATYKAEVGADIELLYGGPIPASKKVSAGIGRSTIVYAMRLVDVTGWMGDDVADLTGGMAWEMWKTSALFFLLIPFATLASFFAAGVGGLIVAWLFIKTVRGALKLSWTPDIIEAIEEAKRELANATEATGFAHEAPTRPAVSLAN